MKYGLIGEHLPHSFSKEIHGLIGRYEKNEYDYEICELAPDELDGFMKRADFKGINVTIPYKEKVIPYLDHIDEAAREIGAVNTIVNRGGRLYGYNTDYFGLRDLIIDTGIELQNRKVLILGTGGTSKTALYVCRSMGASCIYIVSRSAKKNGDQDTDSSTSRNDRADTANKADIIYTTYDEVYDLCPDASVMINTTPVGMYPSAGVSPIDIDRFSSLEGVIDVIYNPLRTELVINAMSEDILAAGGLRMLVTQAVYAYKLFMDNGHGADASVDANPSGADSSPGAYDEPGVVRTLVDLVFRHIYKDKVNIVLIGMPGCGKTTVGKRLAKAYDKKLIDTDTEIIKHENRQITEIFENDGEEYFRRVESEVIKDISLRNGLIIATGGGAVLNKDNIDLLKANGILIFLDRPLETLVPTEDRPTAKDRDMLKQRYEERYDIYMRSCDLRVSDTDKTEEQINSTLI